MTTTYDPTEYDSEDQRENDPLGPPKANIFAAALYIDALLTANKINHAMMGGFAMICRGSQRSTHDIDIVVDASMKKLWEVLEEQPRFKIPNTRFVEAVLKIFVGTGPEFNDSGCSEERWIDVDLVAPGYKGSPLQLTSHQDQVPVAFEGEKHIIPCLDILYMMRLKLENCVTRGRARDIDDVQFLLNNFGREVAEVWPELERDVVTDFLKLEWVRKLPESVIADYRRALGRKS